MALATAAASTACAQECRWENLDGAGLSSQCLVRALAVFDDGTGPALYVGGSFRESNGNPGDRIAKWDGESWFPLGRGMGYSVFSLIVFDDGFGPDLYAGGLFTRAGDQTANGIARWDGQSWSTLGTGVFSSLLGGRNVATTCVYDDGSGPALIAGGRFERAGGVPALNVAKWDGQQWSALGEGIEGYELRDLAVYDDGSGPALYAAGATFPRVARWNGQQWQEVGGDTDNLAHRLAVYDPGTGPSLFVGGQFTWAGSGAGAVPARGVAAWNGAAWSSIGANVDAQVWALGVFDDGAGPGLYVGGAFSTIGGLSTWGIARWDGRWSALSGGLYNGPTFGPNVFALQQFDSGSGPAMYVGGEFLDAGGVPANCVARWKCESTCYPDCDQSTGAGVLDVFDFLCFQNAFVQADPYACDCETSGGLGVCDIFDFLCFQDLFVAGCK